MYCHVCLQPFLENRGTWFVFETTKGTTRLTFISQQMTQMIHLKSFISAEFQVMTRGISTAADLMNIVSHPGIFGFEFWPGGRPW
jgi:hypothetical protein